MNASEFDFLASYIRDRTGIVLDESKHYLLEARLNRLMRDHDLNGFTELVALLKSPKGRQLEAFMIDAMTTNETSFFRDGAPFEHLRESALPDLVEQRRSAKTLRIWSAACSSGQEPYTLAIILRESFPELASWDVKITATDLSEKMVERCKAGFFSEHELGRGMPERLRGRYFQRADGGWQVRQELRDMLDVSQLNLLTTLPVSFKFDLILIRNVLIYFDDPTKEAILRRVHGALAPDGYMMLGTAETPRGVKFVRAEGTRANVFRPAA